jgi:hypothetical protein
VRPLTAPELLHAWEEGRGRTLTDRALRLLAAACPGETPESLLALPVGRRDARLLRLREWTFGPRFVSLARCPACGERLELGFTTADVDAAADADALVPAGAELDVAEDGWQVTFRLPTSADVAALAEGAGARDRLLERCVVSSRRNGRSRPVNRIPAHLLDAVVRRMGEADPQADVHTRLACPACAHGWDAVFDIVSFFWAEIEAWAHRTLRDVHVLASAYGWGEAEILALSPARRQLYLEMVLR